jgi:acyl-CoA thioester hydrolase
MSELKLLIKAPITVRWRDLDALNHVNNTNYLTYLEEARLKWLTQLSQPWFSDTFMPVVASIEINYRRPMEWPATIEVQLYCQHLGNSSLAISHRIVAADTDATLYSDGKVTMVWIGADGKSVALPNAVRTACQ